MREYGFDEIYDYITEGRTVSDKDTIRRNSERLLEIVHYEFQVEGRKRARLSRASKESIDAGIASEEARFQQLVNTVIAEIAAKSTIPHWKDRVEQAQVAAGLTSRHKRYFYYPLRWFFGGVVKWGVLFYIAPILGKITNLLLNSAYSLYAAAVYNRGSYSKTYSDFSSALPDVALSFLWPFRADSSFPIMESIVGLVLIGLLQQYPYRIR